MLKLIRVALLCLFILSLPKANAVTTSDIPGYVPTKVETPTRSTVLRQNLPVAVPEEYKTLISSYAQKYSVEGQNLEPIMTAVIRCESNFNTFALGDGGHSRGLVQIHNVWHPEVTDDQAYDPEFAISFLAKALSEGKGSEWTCYKKLSTAQK